MKNFILALILAVSSVGGYAQTVDLSKLSDGQKKAVEEVVQAAVTKSLAGAPTLDTVGSTMEQFERIGTNAAKGLVSFAKELGVVAGEFAQTPLGMIVTAGMVMHLGGPMITSLIIGVLFTFILFPATAVAAYRCFEHKTIVLETETRPVLFGLWQKEFPTKTVRKEPFETESEGFRAGALIAATIIFMLIGTINFVQ